MSRNHSITAAVLGLALLLTGQTEARAQENIVGVKGGVNSSNFNQSSSTGTEPLGATSAKSGLMGGLYAAFGLTEIFGLQLEAVYTQRGVKSDEPQEATSAKLSLDYVQFPALVTARIPLNGTRLRPLLYAGPAIAFETSCDISGTVEAVEVSFDCDAPEVNMERKKTDFGLMFGAGLEYPMGGIVLGAEARYTLGLTNLNDDPQTQADERVRSRTWSFLATIGIPFEL
jgi:opacity protein-like surface antigen